MRHNLKKLSRRIMATLTASVLLLAGMSVCAQENTNNENGFEKYVTVADRQMRVVLYGDIIQNQKEVSFSDSSKSTLVMLPGLGVASPNLYFKPLAQELDEKFNIIVVEPLGYGLSETALTERSVANINSDLNEALTALGVDECILLVHSISGVYGLNFALDYPDKVKGFIAVDNTVYEDGLAEAFAMEKEYMLNGLKEFNTVRDSFASVEEFRLALARNPEEYGVELPQVQGYTYSEADMEEYICAVSLSANESIESEVNQMDQTLLAVKGKKFPDTLPVLVMVSADNVQNIPIWETAHRNQLNLENGKHKMCILEGSHYIWYTNLTGVVEQISQWQVENQF